tara:strand:- start:74 stop:616 length:543 start_codon:yes stop_codon:yes gene_type:complete
MKKYDTIFLDRDGTLNLDPGYINSLNNFKFFDYTLKSLINLKKVTNQFCIITNQSGVARGLIEIDQLSSIHNFILNKFFENKLNLLGIYYCTDHPDSASINRKPGIGLFKQAAKDHKINLKKSLMIGDSVCDMEAALNCNMESILVLTGNGKKTNTILKEPPTYVSKNLLDASIALIGKI